MKDYSFLITALEKAKEAAKKARTDDDGGTCNFDSPTLDYQEMGIRKSKAIEIIKSVGLGCYESEIYGRRYLVIRGITEGQGNRRTKMAEAFHCSLMFDNIASGMYYQMD